MNEFNGSDRRAHARLRYIGTEPPTLVMLGKSYPITDLSAGGLCLDPLDDQWPEGVHVDATIQFPDGVFLLISQAEVVRTSKGETALALATEIPGDRMSIERKRVQHISIEPGPFYEREDS
ncbi:MAG: hypothetical protein COW42_02425 [Deltaproteobacteria bacterium CG17_big_fil_post_rev_8_21_14_2_50_63_7]|nr:MAG: hypothetical protein COW42_02425 [Deltaproteobacteria bacterium CG17_big_fil_post_rev_8_21_14_2_50_63_7]